MQYAILNGIKSMAEVTGQRAECPGCGGEVLSKCGEINIQHWAHMTGVDCDTWAEAETEWHRGWKNLFPPEWREITIKSDTTGETHRADIKIPNGPVIEFQHSNISSEEIREREDFYTEYGGGIIWVVDGSEFMDKWVKYEWWNWYEDKYDKGRSPFNRVHRCIPRGTSPEEHKQSRLEEAILEFTRWRSNGPMDDQDPDSLPILKDDSDFRLVTDDEFPNVDIALIKPVRWPHARKSWAYSREPVFFDSCERNQTPEKEMIESVRETDTIWAIREGYKNPNPRTNEGYFELGRYEYVKQVYTNDYPTSDIFEWLGTVNSGKDSKCLEPQINNRATLMLNKYIVGRYRPFNDVLSHLRECSNDGELGQSVKLVPLA